MEFYIKEKSCLFCDYICCLGTFCAHPEANEKYFDQDIHFRPKWCPLESE